jgi:hypothetical protein
MSNSTLGAARILAGLIIALLVSTAAAQQPPQLDPLAQQMRIEARIMANGDLTEPERSQMQVNLRACRALGLEPEVIAPLFEVGGPQGYQPATALRLQSEVIRAARGEYPMQPLMAKIQEGRMKGARDDALVRTAGSVVDGMAAADGMLASAAGDGLEPPGGPSDRAAQIRIVSRAMWRGLTPEDGAHLRLRAQERLAHGPVSTADLAAAAETTVRIREQGGRPDEALRLAGAALAAGYGADDLAELARAVTSGSLAGADMGAFLGDLGARVEAGLEAGALHRYIQQSGWMGPADAPGAGGPPVGGQPGDGPGSGDPGSGDPGGTPPGTSGGGSSGAGTGTGTGGDKR